MVGFSFQDEAMDVALSVPQGAHYRADDIYLFPKLGLRREHGVIGFGKCLMPVTWAVMATLTFDEAVVEPRPASLIFVKGVQLINGSPYDGTE